jgi:hypothetical protein
MSNRHRLTPLAFGGYVIADAVTLTWTELTDTAGELLLSGTAESCTAEEAREFLAEATSLGWLEPEGHDG